jgi:hypothetical protein
MTLDIQEILDSYPRCRQPLEAGQQEIYVKEYQHNRSGTAFLPRIVSWLESWCHRQIAAAGQDSNLVLEIGAGNLNHLRYEGRFAAYDVVEPFDELLSQSQDREQVRDEFKELADCPLDRRYDRILSQLTLEHLTDLPSMIAMSGRLLSCDGKFQAGIPSEGGFLWALSWKATTGVAYRIRTGLDYGVLMRHEHVNTAPEIEAVVRYFFERVHVRRFPTPLLHFSTYGYIEATGPRVDRCNSFLEA